MKEQISQSNITKPSEFKHNNDNYAFIDDSQIRGGVKVVNNITERDSIPYDKRGYGIVKHRDSSDNTGSWVVKTYEGSDLLDSSWINSSNWKNISGAEVQIATSTTVGTVKPDNNTISIDSTGKISVPVILSSYNNSVYVSSKQTGIGTGSVANPFSTIQEAVAYMIGSGVRTNPQRRGTIVVDSGSYTLSQSDNLAVEGVNYNLQYIDTIVNYNGNCLDSNSNQVSPVNYAANYIPQFRIKQTITSTYTTLGDFILHDSQLASCKYCTLIRLNNGSGLQYLLMSDNYLVNSEYRPITGIIPNTGYNALFNYTGFGTYNKSNVYGLGTINLNGTAGFMILDGSDPVVSFTSIDVQIITKTSLMPLFYNKITTNSWVYFNFNGTFTNANGTGLWYDNTTSSMVGIKSKVTTNYNIGSGSCTYRGFNGFDIEHLYIGNFAGSFDLRFTNYMFGFGHILYGSTVGLFLSGTLAGDNTTTKQSIGLIKTYYNIDNNNSCGFYISNLTRARQLTSTGMDCVFVGPSSNLAQDIISFYSNPHSFVIVNSQLGRKLSSQTLSYLGIDKTTNIPSVNNFSTDLIFNKIPTSALPDNSYVITVDSDGVSQKVLASEIKTPGMVVSDTFYTTQTTVANFIANDSQVSTITKSNLLSLSDGTLYVLVSTDSSTESNYKQITTVVSWSSITSKPSFATVATSADYADLINKPDLSVYALIADQDGGATVVLTANTDILAVLRAYIAALYLDSTTRLIQRSISFVVGSYTATFGTYSFTGDVSFRLSCRLSSGAYLAIGDMQVLNSSFQSPTTHDITITSSAYSVDRLAKYSEITSSGWTTSKLHQLHLKPGSPVSCTTTATTIGMAPSHSRNWPTSGIAPCSGYVKINGAVTWQANGGTSFGFSLNLLINSTSISLSTDYPPSSTGKDKTTAIFGYYPITAGDSISLTGTTTANNAIVQISTNVVYEIVED